MTGLILLISTMFWSSTLVIGDSLFVLLFFFNASDIFVPLLCRSYESFLYVYMPSKLIIKSIAISVDNPLTETSNMGLNF